jgi:outer membrane protein assembly factor BamA
MKVTGPFRLLLAAVTGLVIVTPAFAQTPQLRLGDPIPQGSPPPPNNPAPLVPNQPPQQNPPAPRGAPPVTLVPPPGAAPVLPNMPPPPVIAGPGQPLAVPLDQGPFKVGEVKIFGNQVTKDYVIRRQIPLGPGQILSFPDLRIAERNLAGLGIFIVDPATGVHPTVTVDPESPNEFRNILVHVDEARTTSLMFGVTVNSDAGLNGSAVFDERNFDLFGWPNSLDDFRTGRAFRGGGQELRAEVTPGTQEQRYVLAFREPFLFDTLFSLTTSGYYYQFVYHDEYTESRLGARLSLARKLAPNWSFEGTVRLEDVGVHHIPFAAPPDIALERGDHFLAGFRGSAVYDTRDSIFRPTQGYTVNLSFEEVTGDFTFPKLILGGNDFWTVGQRPDGSGKQVIALRSELGYAGSSTPVFERFYAGGFRTLRGFAFRGVGPSDRGVEVGGDFEFLSSLEYQAPILANDRLLGVLFLDSGTVEPSLEIKHYRVAAGVGARLFIPQLGPLPLAFDFGFPINRAHGDHTQLFSFFAGLIF